MKKKEIQIIKRLKKQKSKKKRDIHPFSDMAITLTLDFFKDTQWAISLEDIKTHFDSFGYDSTVVVSELINYGILQIDILEPKIYLALSGYGIHLWEERHEKKSG